MKFVFGIHFYVFLFVLFFFLIVSTPPNKRNGLKVTNPDDLKGQSGQKGTPSSMRGGSVQRRHTVTTGKAEQEFQSMRRDEVSDNWGYWH